MADTLPNVTLPRGVWVNINAEPGQPSAGVAVRVQNLGQGELRYCVSATEPDGAAFNNSTKGHSDEWIIFEGGQNPIWYYSPSVDGAVNIQVVS